MPSHGKMETEIGVMLPQSKELLEHPKLEEARKDPMLVLIKQSPLLENQNPDANPVVFHFQVTPSHVITFRHGKKLDVILSKLSDDSKPNKQTETPKTQWQFLN